MKRKLSIFLLVFVLVASLLIGCGAETTTETSGETSNSEKVIKIGVFQPMTGANAAGG